MREGSPAEVFGPYLVYEELGAGGMASVHRAEIAGIEGFTRQVALKRMLPHVAASAEMVQSFVREAHLASHLRHTNVAQTYELGKVGDTYFIAMELIEGKSLRAILKHCVAHTGPMPIPVALNILNQICDALDYAHNLCDETGQALGIIHRDVSPSNIIVARGGTVKLIDFGIAKVKARGSNTLTGTVKGKFGYMAPEYIEGSLDARADLFAVGVIAHELFTNVPLFSTGEELETLQRVRSMNIPPPSSMNTQVPADVEEIVMTALSRDPEARWQNATALRTAMGTVTKRLGLEIHNQQIAEWIEWLYAHTPRQPGDEPEIGVEQKTEQSVKRPNESQQLTAVSRRTPLPPQVLPMGTPHRMTAQSRAQSPASIEPEAPTAVRSPRKLSTPVPTIPGLMRASQPIAVPRTFTPPRAPLAQASVPPQPAVPAQPPLAYQPPPPPVAQPRPAALPPPPGKAHPPQVAPQRGGNLIGLMLLVLLVVAAVAAGAYFGLPLLRS